MPPAETNPGTIGTAADWLLQFVIHPEPDLELTAYGAVLCADARILISRRAVDQALSPLGVSIPQRPPAEVRTFVGPRAGTTGQPDALYRACWLLALLTEASAAGQPE